MTGRNVYISVSNCATLVRDNYNPRLFFFSSFEVCYNSPPFVSLRPIVTETSRFSPSPVIDSIYFIVPYVETLVCEVKYSGFD